jgi:hypothetical protein
MESQQGRKLMDLTVENGTKFWSKDRALQNAGDPASLTVSRGDLLQHHW